MPERIQERGRFRRGVTRTGVLLSAAVLAVFAVVVLIFVIRSPSKATGEEAPPPSGPAPDIKQLPTGGGMSNVSGGGRFNAQIVAKDDPLRLTGEISAQRYEPLPDQRFKLEKPEGWAFLRSGRTVHISADTGRTYMPDQSKGASPRDAVLEGNVVVKVFDPREDGKRPDLNTDVPFAVITTSVLKFDGELGQVRLPEDFVLNSEIADWVARDLTVLFNDVEQRLEWLHAAHTTTLVLKPGYKTPARPPAAPAPSLVAAGAAPSSPTAAAGAKKLAGKPPEFSPITLYHMVCTDKVHVEQTGRTIDAEKLDGWARLVDNTLRPEAIAGARISNGTPAAAAGNSGAPTAPGGTGVAPAPPAIAAEPGPFEGFDDKSLVTLTFDGPLDIRPLTEAPGELAYNDVFVRFTSGAAGGVRFADPHNGAAGSGTLMDYGATRREIALASGEENGTTVSLPGSGTATGKRYEMNLASGVVHARGAGAVSAQKSQSETGGDAGTARSLAWSDQAEFRFILNEKHEMTSVVSAVSAGGDVRATDGKGSLTGTSLNATFTPVSAKASRVDHLQVAGNAKGEDGGGGSLLSDTLEVSFVATPDKPDQSDPRILTAQGHVVGERAGARIATESLSAQISRDEEGKLAVEHVDVSEGFAFENNDGVHAQGRKLAAAPGAGIAHIFGGDSVVSKEGTVITGQDITMWQADGRMKVASAGTLVHDGPVGDPNTPQAGQPAHVEVAWSREMEFEDVAGRAKCLGDVGAVLTKAARPAEQIGVERDTVRGEEVDLTFTPGVQRAPGEKEPDVGPRQERRLLTVQCVGVPNGDGNEKPASIESRRYAASAPAGGEPPLERILFLESVRISVDNGNGTVSTPEAGKLLIMDRRATDKAPVPGRAARAPFDTAAGSRGASLFSWQGSMDMDRGAGLVHLNDHVRLVHRPDDKADKTELECEKLTANVRELGKGDSPESFSGELVSADAEGAAWMRSGTHELIADLLHYDALKKLVNAKGAANNLVQVFDARQDGQAAAPITARELEWDLLHDSITITRPSPVLAPR